MRSRTARARRSRARHWRSRFGGEAKRLDLPRIEAGGVLDLGGVELRAPDVADAAREPICFELRAPDGTVLATNRLDAGVSSARERPIHHRQRVWSPDDAIKERFRALGYAIARGLDDSTLVVSATHEEAMAAHVRQGASLLLLPEANIPLYPFFPHWQNVKVLNRDGTLWRGDWASSFAWLRRSDPFAGFPSGPLLDETFDRVIPTHVITGCNLLDFQARVFGGLVVGWIHKPVALGVERSYGRGRLVASTFRLFRDAPGADPTATTLLDAMVALAVESRASRLEEAVRAAEAAA